MATLGVIGYARRFIPNLSKYLIPLSRLLKKRKIYKLKPGARPTGIDLHFGNFTYAKEDVIDEEMRELNKGENIFDDHFQYSLYKENIVEIVQMNDIPEALAALEAIKLIIKNTPILIPPNPTKQYIIYTDASEKSLGAVLCQIADDGRLRPIEYMSQNFSSDIADREDIPSKELRAINAALIKFKPYISKRQDTVVFCDNSANVLGLSASHETSATIEKMKFRITQHGIILKHIAGPSNPIADYLSRLMNPIKTSRSPQTAIP